MGEDSWSSSYSFSFVERAGGTEKRAPASAREPGFLGESPGGISLRNSFTYDPSMLLPSYLMAPHFLDVLEKGTYNVLAFCPCTKDELFIGAHGDLVQKLSRLFCTG